MTTDFKDQIKQIGERVHRLKEMLKTEEATKTAFVMPLLQHLGYDIFNPTEVVPEFITDIGTKKGEKIDYAIFKDDAPAILIECKHWNQNLNLQRQVNGNVVTDNYTRLITRYFLLKLTYRFNKNKTKEDDFEGWH